MAIRYSGDTEIRFGYDKYNKIYRGNVRDPKKRWTGNIKIFWLGSPYDSRAYDKAALALLKKAQQDRGRFILEIKNNKIVLRRVFQSPCPNKMIP